MPWKLLIFPIIILHCYSNFVNASEQYYSVGLNCILALNFTEGSSYGKNLNTLLMSLSSTANETTTNGGYFATNTTALMGSSTTEPIYGNFFCRGDIGPQTCKDCVAKAIRDALSNGCKSAKSATTWWNLCMVRYSNTSFAGKLDEDTFWPLANPNSFQDGEAKQFLGLVVSTLNRLAQKVASSGPGPSNKYYGTINGVQFKDLNLYTMAQCVPDIDSTMCRSCLNMCTNHITDSVCSKSKGCQMKNPQCSVRYEIYSFEEESSVPVPVPVPVPAPPLDLNSATQPIAIAPVKKRFKPQALSIALGSLAVIVVLLLVVLCYILRKRMKRLKNKNVQEMMGIYPRSNHAASNRFGSPDMTTESLQFDFKTLQYATDNFSEGNKLGGGGFGNVYKGYLPNGNQIAIKRLSKDSVQGAEQFKTEVLLVAKLQHRNLVRLLGYCLTSQEKLLVYEYVPRKSLDFILFDPNMQGQLDWSIRYKIIKGIARGILYLHEDSRLKIVHRDLKASNILLDVDMNPKISDFGLARNFELNQKQDVTHRVAGTLGYMAPEYMEYGEFSVESDVYSFGILVLEIISGRKISSRLINGLAENLLTFAWKHWNEDNAEEFMDSSMRDSYSRDEVMRCLHIGLLCVQRRMEDRPSMISVVLYLNSNQLVLPVPQQPMMYTDSQNGSRSGTREQFSDRSIKTGSSSGEAEIRSAKSTSTSKSTSSVHGTEGGSTG